MRNTDLLENVVENVDVNLVMKQFPEDKQFTNLVNKLRSTGLLMDRKQKYKRQVLTEKNFGDTGARLEHITRKSLTLLDQENGVPKSV
jgi:hypothetical protein